MARYGTLNVRYYWPEYTTKSFCRPACWSSAVSKVTSHRAKQFNSLIGGNILSPIDKTALTVSLAITRSNLLLNPGIFSVTSGKLKVAWPQISSAGVGDMFKLKLHAQGAHGFVTKLGFAVVEGAIMFVRAIYLLFLFTPIMMMAPFARFCEPESEFRRWWLDVVCQSFEEAGPAFIQLGQWAARQPHIFPEDLCTKLHSEFGFTKLLTRIVEELKSAQNTRKTMEKAFGRHDEIFVEFERQLVASVASLRKPVNQTFGVLVLLFCI